MIASLRIEEEMAERDVLAVILEWLAKGARDDTIAGCPRWESTGKPNCSMMKDEDTVAYTAAVIVSASLHVYAADAQRSGMDSTALSHWETIERVKVTCSTRWRWSNRRIVVYSHQPTPGSSHWTSLLTLVGITIEFKSSNISSQERIASCTDQRQSLAHYMPTTTTTQIGRY
jgi:hypothetical protein